MQFTLSPMLNTSAHVKLNDNVSICHNFTVLSNDDDAMN